MRRKAITLALAGAALAMSLAACDSSGTTGGNAAESAQQQQDTTAIEFAVPLPEFPSSTLRQELVLIEATEALGIRSTTFAITTTGDLMWSCPSIGLPVPVTDELSNPSQVVNDQYSYQSDGAVVGQMDPDGVYKGDSTGTYVVCLDSNGNPYIRYAEEFADAATASAHWSATAPHIVVTGAAEIPVCTVVKVNRKRMERCTDPDATSVSNSGKLKAGSASPSATP
jgi:hypothetical protein